MEAPVVALVLVSHSARLAAGLADLAAEMAPDVAVLAAGGTADGALGTSFDRVQAALEAALAGGRSAVVLTDLGSAVLTAESVLETVEPAVAARVRVADAPFVEAAVEAAVVAQGGGDLDAVLAAAGHAGAPFGGTRRTAGAGSRGVAAGPAPADAAQVGPGVSPADAARTSPRSSPADAARTSPRSSPADASRTARGHAVLRNRLGLHARPAASLARTAAAFASAITVNGADARSVLALVGLGAAGGAELVVTATGPDARTAVNAVVAELEEGFGEA